MSALLSPWPVLCIGLWVAIVGGLILFGHRLETVRPTVAEPTDDEGTRWIAVLPPVPPSDAAWLSAWPTDLSDEQVDRLFDDLIAIEGLDR